MSMSTSYINPGDHLLRLSTSVSVVKAPMTVFVYLKLKSFGACTIKRMLTMPFSVDTLHIKYENKNMKKVPDEQVHEKTGTDEGAGDKPEVPDVPKHHSNSEEESWTFSDDDDDEDDDANKDLDAHDDDDDERLMMQYINDDGDNITRPKLSTFSTEDQEENNDEEEQEEDDEDEEEISDQLVRTPSDYQTSDESEKQKDDDKVKNGEEDKEGDVTNVALEGGDVDMTEADTTEDTKDAHVTLTAATPIVQQQSSSMSDLVSKFISPTTDEGIDSILNPHTESTTLVNVPISVATETPATTTTIPPPLFPKNLYNALVEAYNTDKDLAQAAGTQSSFDEFMTTPIDFSAFMINRLKIDHLTQELLTGPTYDLIKGTPYPHNLSKLLPLIPNARERLVIPFDHFINNDLKYLKGGSSSRKYTTSITKTKAADYGQVKWIEDRIPRTTWSVVPIDYDKHAYWGTYHWGLKCQRFYGYATNMETSKDVYSRHRIITVISLKIMKFFGYSHLEEITVRRQDDVLYKFREGDFKRLRRQDIEDN
ncbi:hypothetical protein Tco_1057993 [Tanacetum coccineum]|uniref:Uncharacterized protein n=1 Tax=Tanacetum coccineum TaxID=301880 RepID=A0ABQ5H7X1_9ASTR